MPSRRAQGFSIGNYCPPLCAPISLEVAQGPLCSQLGTEETDTPTTTALDPWNRSEPCLADGAFNVGEVHTTEFVWRDTSATHAIPI
jgi:hypothetical protein